MWQGLSVYFVSVYVARECDQRFARTGRKVVLKVCTLNNYTYAMNLVHYSQALPHFFFFFFNTCGFPLTCERLEKKLNEATQSKYGRWLAVIFWILLVNISL